MLERGHEEDRVDLGRQLAIGVRHLQLGLEIADRAQATDDEAGTDSEREVDGQAIEAGDLDARGLPRGSSSSIASRMASIASSSDSSGDFLGLISTPTTSLSKTPAARR